MLASAMTNPDTGSGGDITFLVVLAIVAVIAIAAVLMVRWRRAKRL